MDINEKAKDTRTCRADAYSAEQDIGGHPPTYEDFLQARLRAFLSKAEENDEEDDCGKTQKEENTVVMMVTPLNDYIVMTFAEAVDCMPWLRLGSSCRRDFAFGLTVYFCTEQTLRTGYDLILNGPALVCLEDRKHSLVSMTLRETCRAYRYLTDNTEVIPCDGGDHPMLWLRL